MKDKKEVNLLQETPLIGNELEKRKERIISFLKRKRDWAYYLILSFIISVSLYIRTLNISKLKDITTGTWTLGPDLDPFLFLRWAEYIAEHGKLFLIDTMRYVPLGYNTAGEMKLLSYMIVGFHRFLSFFSSEISITYSAILFPVAMFGLTLIAFFLFSRKIFYKESKKTRNIIALISTAFLAFIPSLLPRTIAGIPEKESAAFLFIFLSFYFFLGAFTSEKFKKGLIFGVLAGICTGVLALIWGGIIFVFLTISGAVLFAFLLGKIDEKKTYLFLSWIVSSLIVMIPFSTRYTFKSLVSSTSTGMAFMVLFILLIDFLLFKKNLFNFQKRIKLKIPSQIVSLIISVILLIVLSTVFFGFSFIPNQIFNIIGHTVHPLQQSRFSVTVAENQQPYFANDWRNDFGPAWFNIPIYFWLFFIGSTLLFHNLIKTLKKKEKNILTFAYFIFLLCLVFSRLSSGSILDGSSNLSLLMYFGGWIFFLGSFIYFYFKRNKEKELSVFKEFEFSYILYFIILTMAVIAARGALRLIMVLGAISPVAVGFLIFKFPRDYVKEKEETKKLFLGFVAVVIIVASVFTLWTYYKQDKSSAENFAPGIYQWQWQKAMEWVRENTLKDSVFAHWWDYGYWLQSIGKRATVLDGGNTIAYWNHLMGRHVLTGTDERTALEFLYAHNTTHLLIDSTEIGKYTAFSSIGSDENYDRFSWITSFLKDDEQTYETSNETFYVYQGGVVIDDDIIWEENGKEIFLPRKKAVVGAIVLRKKSETGGIFQPEAVFFYNEKQYKIPLRFIYIGGELHDFNSGLEAGIFLFPKLEQSGNEFSIKPEGALLYLSKRTINSQLARLYLFGQESNYFKIAHTESDFFINNLKEQGYNFGEFIYYNGFRGPIKIWEVKYPSDIRFNEDYLKTEYPEELQTVKSGEYN